MKKSKGFALAVAGAAAALLTIPGVLLAKKAAYICCVKKITTGSE